MRMVSERLRMQRSEILRMRDDEGMTFREIGFKLGFSAGNAIMVYKRCKARAKDPVARLRAGYGEALRLLRRHSEEDAAGLIKQFGHAFDKVIVPERK